MHSSPSETASELRPTWLEIDLGALARNFARVRERVAPRRVWCVVKADAYGHGAAACSRRLQREGADAFAVATVDEGVALRQAGIEGRILVLAGIEPVETEIGRAAAKRAVEHDLEVAVWRPQAARVLGAAAQEAGAGPARLHLKVDTGMGRLGVTAGDDLEEALGAAAELARTDGVVIEGLFSNLAAADVPAAADGHEHTAVQAERFGRLCAELERRDLLPAERHLGNSAAVLHHAGTWQPDWCTGVRPGLALCGVSSLPGDVTLPLEPVMSWHSVVAAVRRLPCGWPLGYGGTRTAARDCTIAVVPVGYHDGFPRALSDRGAALIDGRRAPAVGAISMDLTLFDITAISATREGAPVVLLGASGDSEGDVIDAHELAAGAGTIAHEILSRVGRRVPHRYVDTSS